MLGSMNWRPIDSRAPSQAGAVAAETVEMTECDNLVRIGIAGSWAIQSSARPPDAFRARLGHGGVVRRLHSVSVTEERRLAVVTASDM